MTHATTEPGTAAPADARGICLFGAAMDTANLGVSALSHAVVYGLARSAPDLHATVFDFSPGVETRTYGANGARVVATRCGGYLTKRLYRPEALGTIRFCLRLGGLGNPGAKALRRAAAVLDISGGDSFTDLYGPWRLRAIVFPKTMALDLGTPLILLPQTYGPFRSPQAAATARRIVRGAAMCWARDARSFEVLQGLLGDAFDADRHRLGVDVAFGLPTASPPAKAVAPIAPWLADCSVPLIGLNVSGLLLNTPGVDRSQYGFQADYAAVIHGFVQRLLRDTDARILLVPHVVSAPGHYESDIGACEAVARAAGPDAKDRLAVCPALHDPTQIKAVIARCDWFCGTRMHATIAALSSGIPTAAIAYSPKTLGVFESCGQGDHVADPRAHGTEAVIAALWDSWQARAAARETLAEALPAVKAQAAGQMDAIAAAIPGGAE